MALWAGFGEARTWSGGATVASEDSWRDIVGVVVLPLNIVRSCAVKCPSMKGLERAAFPDGAMSVPELFLNRSSHASIMISHSRQLSSIDTQPSLVGCSPSSCLGIAEEGLGH